MFKSLRWRLQVWHAFVLLIVVFAFGGIVHRLHWQTRMQQIDAELDRAVGIVMTQLRRLLPRTPRRSPRPDDIRPEVDLEPRMEPSVAARPAPAEGENNPEKSDRPQGFQRFLRERMFHDPGPLPPEFEELFHGDQDSSLYYVIWNEKGEVLQKSEFAPDMEFPNVQVLPFKIPEPKRRDRVAGHVYREVIFQLPFTGRNLLVGRSLEKDFVAYRQSGLFLIGTGFVILAAGLIGGGWLTARAIRPITEMTKAAEAISALHLSERIDVKDADTELGQLAVVLNRTFDRLQSAFERQSQFTADASHELRTPLSVIATHTELALSRQRSPEEYRLALETCQHAAQRMKSLIDVLLQLARFDSERSSLKKDELNLEPLIVDCVELVQSMAREKQVRIETQLSDCRVLGDGNRLSQVFTNLLTNAIRYNIEGGLVRITTRVDADMAVITVADTGIGIAEKDLLLIFDRFYQVDKVRSRAEGSCGLGLSISRTIIEAHGGAIRVTSELKVGTTVEVRLPRATVQPASQRPVESEEKLVSALSGL